MPLITISQNTGCRGSEIAQMVAEQLGTEVYDDVKLRERAIALGFSESDLKGLGQTSPRFFDRLFSRKPEVYMDLTATVIYDVAREGEGVIIGHCSQLLLNDFNCALHVLISAPFEDRVHHTMKLHRIDKDTAQRLLHKRENEQKGYLQYACGLNSDSTALYDLVINTAKTGPESAAGLIVALARAEEVRTCSMNALGAMQRLSLERRAHAALLRANFDVAKLTLEAPTPGEVTVRGLVETPEQKEHLQKVLLAVDQVNRVNADVVVMAVPFH